MAQIRTQQRPFGRGFVTTHYTEPDGNCLQRAIYAQRFRRSWEFRPQQVEELIQHDRDAVKEYMAAHLGTYEQNLLYNGGEARGDNTGEWKGDSVMRALEEVGAYGVFVGEEFAHAYSTIHRVWIQIFPEGGIEDEVPLRLYFDGDGHYESIDGARFDSRQVERKVDGEVSRS